MNSYYIKAQDYINVEICNFEINSFASYNLFFLNNVYLIQDEGIILTEHGQAVEECFIYKDHLKDFKYSVLRNVDISFRNNLTPDENETFLSLLGVWGDSFWHWFIEFLPKVVIAEQFGFKGKYIIKNDSPFKLESLKMLGINQDRLLLFHGETLFIKNLLLPEPLRANDKKILPVIELLRQKILSSVSQTSFDERIYISREFSKHGRKIINENELMEVLKKYEFKKVYMETLSLKEQIPQIINCRFLIGGHGAGMTHSLFIPEKSNIIELFAPTYINYCLNPVIEILKHRYFPVVSLNHDPLSPYSGGYDIKVPVDLIEIILKNEIGNL